MATITLEVVAGAQTVATTRTVSNANASRVMTAERMILGTTDDQTTLDEMLRRALSEWIGNTKTIERNQNAVADIPVT